jgi:hypothetical protein
MIIIMIFFLHFTSASSAAASDAQQTLNISLHCHDTTGEYLSSFLLQNRHTNFFI